MKIFTISLFFLFITNSHHETHQTHSDFNGCVHSLTDSDSSDHSQTVPSQLQPRTKNNKNINLEFRFCPIENVSILCISSQNHVQKHISIGIPVNIVQYRQQTPANLGQESAKWPYKAYHRQRYPELGARNCWNKCQHHLYHLSSRPEEDTRD